MSVHIPTMAIVLPAVLALPALIAACFVAACRRLSRLSGWAHLSDVYAAGMMPRGKRFEFQSARIGNVAYLKCLEIYAAPEGIFMRLPFGLNVGHRLLLIPWVDLRHQRRAGHRGKSVCCEVGVGSPVTVELPSEIVECLTEVAPDSDCSTTLLRTIS